MQLPAIDMITNIMPDTPQGEEIATFVYLFNYVSE